MKKPNWRAVVAGWLLAVPATVVCTLTIVFLYGTFSFYRSLDGDWGPSIWGLSGWILGVVPMVIRLLLNFAAGLVAGRIAKSAPVFNAGLVGVLSLLCSVLWLGLLCAVTQESPLVRFLSLDFAADLAKVPCAALGGFVASMARRGAPVQDAERSDLPRRALAIGVVGVLAVAGVGAYSLYRGTPVFIDTDGNRVKPPPIEFSRSFTEGVLGAHERRGVPLEWLERSIDERGMLVYSYPTRFSGDLDGRPLQEGAQDWLIGDVVCYFDADGNELFEVPGHAIYARPFSEGLAAIELSEVPAAYMSDSPDSDWGYVDKTGEFVIAPTFDMAVSFSEGLALVGVDGKKGYIDHMGEFVIPPRFEDANSFSEGLAAARVDSGWGYIDKTGAFVIEPQFDEAGSFSEGLAPVEVRVDPSRMKTGPVEDGIPSYIVTVESHKWGYIDKTGEFVIPLQFGEAGSFSEGLAAVCLEDAASGPYGYIDKTGHFKIEPQYSHAGDFSDGIAMVFR